MIHFCRKYLIPQRREERRGVEKATGQLSHTASLNTAICALEICNHNVEQGLLMFKSSKRCSFHIRMNEERNKETDTQRPRINSSNLRFLEQSNRYLSIRFRTKTAFTSSRLRRNFCLGRNSCLGFTFFFGVIFPQEFQSKLYPLLL